jgi:hypothetical protein
MAALWSALGRRSLPGKNPIFYTILSIFIVRLIVFSVSVSIL